MRCLLYTETRRTLTDIRYIIDRYDTLPANVLFHHAGRFQWHNDNPNYDALELLQNFRFPYLKRQGYVNMRCAWVLGCPVEIEPIKDASDKVINEPVTAKRVYKQAFMELFPGEEVPDKVGVTCCSQFAVRRETIRRRPKEDYIRYRTWLEKSDLPDNLSGRVLEYAWHSKFGLASAGDEENKTANRNSQSSLARKPSTAPTPPSATASCMASATSSAQPTPATASTRCRLSRPCPRGGRSWAGRARTVTGGGWSSLDFLFSVERF